MKNLYKLINFQFGFIYRLVLIECLLLIVVQNILLYITKEDNPADRYIPFEKLIALSGLPAVFYIGFVLTLAGCVYSVLSDYSGSKGIYTLMTIPGGRYCIYFSKVIPGLIYFLMLICSQLISILSGYMFFSTPISVNVADGLISYSRPVNGLFLAFVRSDFLRLLFPMSAESFISTFMMEISLILGIFFISYAVLARRYRQLVFPLLNILTVIFEVNKRNASVLAGGNQNLYVFSIILFVFSLFYVYQSIKWLKNSAILG